MDFSKYMETLCQLFSNMLAPKSPTKNVWQAEVMKIVEPEAQRLTQQLTASHPTLTVA